MAVVISFTDKEIKKASGKRVAFVLNGKEYLGVIRDFWGAGHYWVKVDGEPKDWSIAAKRLNYVDQEQHNEWT